MFILCSTSLGKGTGGKKKIKLMKNILSFFHLIDEVPGIAGALIGQSRQSGASSIKKWVWFKTLSIWFKVFLDHDSN